MQKRQLKQSLYQYRTIKGKCLVCLTASTDLFDLFIKRAKDEKKLYRIIEGQLYVEGAEKW